MKYSRFEELPFRNAAMDLSVRVYQLTADKSWVGQGSLKDRLERAAVSISNNIAEGFEQGTTRELLAFLYIARGSAGEVRSMLRLLERLPAFLSMKSQISDLKLLAENCSRQLRGWADWLQETPIEGQRHLTKRVRQADEARRGREEFLEELKHVRAKN